MDQLVLCARAFSSRCLPNPKIGVPTCDASLSFLHQVVSNDARGSNGVASSMLGWSSEPWDAIAPAGSSADKTPVRTSWTRPCRGHGGFCRPACVFIAPPTSQHCFYVLHRTELGGDDPARSWRFHSPGFWVWRTPASLSCSG